MPIIRVEKSGDNPFVQIDRDTLQDESLSWKARGLLAYLLSLPDDWEVRKSHLKKQAPDGECSLNTAMDELIETGYIERDDISDEDSPITKYRYTIYEAGKSRTGKSVPTKTDDKECDVTTNKKHNIQDMSPDKPGENFSDQDSDRLREIDVTLRNLGIRESESPQLARQLYRQVDDIDDLDEFLELMEWETESNGKGTGFIVWAICNPDQYDRPGRDNQASDDEDDDDYPDPGYDWRKFI